MENTASPDEGSHRDIIAKFRVELVQAIDPDRQFLFSYLRSKKVFDDEDCELILNAGASRQQKVSKLLDMLVLKGPGGLNHFIDALEYEHPQLFEKISGKKASISRMIPSPIPVTQSAWDFTTGLSGKELIDFDRQYLAKQLEKITVDFQTLTYVHSKAIREKNSLEQRLQETVRDLEVQEKANNDLKFEIKIFEDQVRESKVQKAQGIEPMNRYVQELVRDNMEKSNIVIALHSRLLSSNDELERCKHSVGELREKNENLMKQIKELVINYDTERRQSKRLNDKVRRQSDQVRQVEEYKKRNYELKYELAKITAERDDALTQVEEFRNVTEALNAKYDILNQERNMALQYQSHFQGQCLSIEQQALLFEEKLREASGKAEEWHRKYERAKEELVTTKEQRDTLLTEREAAISDRNSALRERDVLKRHCEELQEAKDDAINRQIEINRKLETQYKVVSKELEDAREELQQLQNESITRNQKDRIFTMQLSDELHSDSEVLPSGWDSGRDSDAEDGERKGQPSYPPPANYSSIPANRSWESMSQQIIQSYPWRKRTTLDVLKSAYGKLNSSDDGKVIPGRHLKRHSDGLINGVMSNEELELVHSNKLRQQNGFSYPNFELLSGFNIMPTMQQGAVSGIISQNFKNTSSAEGVISSMTGTAEDIRLEETAHLAESISEIWSNNEKSGKYQRSPTADKDVWEENEGGSAIQTTKEVKKTTVSAAALMEPKNDQVIVNEEDHVVLHHKKVVRASRVAQSKSDVLSIAIPGVTKIALGLGAPLSMDNFGPSSPSPRPQEVKSPRKNSKGDSKSPTKEFEPAGTIPKAMTSLSNHVKQNEMESMDLDERLAKLRLEKSEPLPQNASRSTFFLQPVVEKTPVSRKLAKNVSKKILSSHSMSAEKGNKVFRKSIARRRSSWTVTDQADV